MNRTAYLLAMIFIVSLGAQEGAQSPVSVHVKEGKSVYVPIAKPVNLYEEVSIQKEDQNTTKLGNAK